VQVKMLNLNSQEICKVPFVEHMLIILASNNAQGNKLILCKLRNITSNFFQIVGKKVASATYQIFKIIIYIRCLINRVATIRL